MPRTLPEWTYLNCAESGDGEAIVIPAGTEPIDALIALLDAVYGGGPDGFSRENPVIVEAAQQVKVETWRSCTKAWREAELGGVDETFTDWWAPHGDGKREVLVAWYPEHVYDLGDEAEAWERREQEKRDGG